VEIDPVPPKEDGGCSRYVQRWRSGAYEDLRPQSDGNGRQRCQPFTGNAQNGGRARTRVVGAGYRGPGGVFRKPGSAVASRFGRPVGPCKSHSGPDFPGTAGNLPAGFPGYQPRDGRRRAGRPMRGSVMTENMPEAGEMSDIRAGLDEVCALLAKPSPQALDSAAAILSGVVADLSAARRRRGRHAQRDEYRGIRRASRLARILLEKAAAYHAGWNAWLGSLTGGYCPGGAAAAPMARGRISIEG